MKFTLLILFSLLTGMLSAANPDDIIKVDKIGKGSPMILIHGMSCSSEVWEEVAGYYRNSYEVHLVNIAGFGNDEPLDAPHVLKAIRDAVITYVKNEGLDRPVLMGHSMGGFIALWAAAEVPGLFGKIITIDGLPYYPVLAWPGMTPEAAVPMAEQMKAGIVNQTPEAAKEFQDVLIASMISNESKREEVVKMGLRSNPKVIAQAMGEMLTTDIRDEVSVIEEPVLALGSWYAYRNYGTTKESATSGYLEQFNKISDSEFRMAERAYHFIFYDEPVWFFQQVDRFLGLD